jgi:GGDEF domain-containing protein
MSEDPRIHRTPRAGPVAGLPIVAMLSRAEELARRWAVALVLARPLEGLGDVPLEDLAREAPALCAQLVRTLESDAELELLIGGRSPAGREENAPALRLAAMSGARDAAALVEAAEALRGVLWEALLEELRWPVLEQSHARRIADTSDRLAYACASALAAALGAEMPQPDPDGDTEPAFAEVKPPPDPLERKEAAERRVVIVDEREQVPASPRGTPAEIEIRDERGEVGPAAWIGSIGRQLERFRRDGQPFAVLLVELGDVQRLRRDDGTEETSLLLEQLEQALASELRSAATPPTPNDGPEPGGAPWSGSFTRERPGRYWLLAPATDGRGARGVAERLIAAVRGLARHRGVLLEVAIGTAICPEDGREAAALAAHADLELYAARASARTAAAGPPASVDDPA